MQQRLDYIDALRGLAILGVVLVHCGQAIAGLPEWLQNLTAYGGRGVQLFFILSALTLMTVYRGQNFSIKSFAIRRFFRLAPMFYLALVVYLSVNGTVPRPDAPDGIGLKQIALTASFLHGWSISSINSIVPGGWSIADEVMFYVLFPLILLRLRSGQRTAIALLLAVVMSRASFMLIPKIGSGEYPTHMLNEFAAFCFPTQLPAFFGGVLVYYHIQWFNAHPAHRLWRNARLACAAIVAILILCATSPSPMLRNYLFADLLLMILVISVYLAQPKIIVNSIFRVLGRVSYSLYLIHFLVLDAATSLCLPHLNTLSPTLQLIALYSTILFISAVLASLAWKWMEQPMIAWGKKFSSRYAATSR